VIAALLLLAAAAAAPEENCGDLPQQPMNRCLHEAYQRVDAELNRQWRIAAEAMKANDRVIDRSYDKDPGYFDTLLAGQRAWLTYRSQQCLAESFAMRGGSGAPMVHSLCMSRITRARIEELKHLVDIES
jgi:uncharacterized protein YecT (DUF1311 family)